MCEASGPNAPATIMYLPCTHEEQPMARNSSRYIGFTLVPSFGIAVYCSNCTMRVHRECVRTCIADIIFANLKLNFKLTRPYEFSVFLVKLRNNEMALSRCCDLQQSETCYFVDPWAWKRSQWMPGWQTVQNGDASENREMEEPGR